MNDLLTFTWSALTDSADGLDHLGTVAELCARHPEHPICAVARRGDGDGHAGAANGHGHGHGAHAAVGNDGGVWDNPLDGEPNQGGSLGWFPFS